MSPTQMISNRIFLLPSTRKRFRNNLSYLPPRRTFCGKHTEPFSFLRVRKRWYKENMKLCFILRNRGRFRRKTTGVFTISSRYKRFRRKITKFFFVGRNYWRLSKKSHPEPFLPVSKHTEFRKGKRNFLCILPIGDGFVWKWETFFNFLHLQNFSYGRYQTLQISLILKRLHS